MKSINRWMALLVTLVLLFTTVYIPESAVSVAAAEEEYYTTIEEAAVELREKMEDRISPITICYATTEEFANLPSDLFDLAVAHTGVPTQGDYLKWHYNRYSMDLSGYQRNGVFYLNITYRVDYRSTAEQEQQVTEEVQRVLEKLDVAKASDYEKICAIYDYISDHVEYDWRKADVSHTAYAALHKGKAVCQGYATLFYRLALELGLDARLISGCSVNTEGKPERHGWNIVRLDGVYYNVDVTWDSIIRQADLPYEFFLKSDGDFDGHQRDEAFATAAFYQEYPMTKTGYVAAPKDGWTQEGGKWYFYQDGAVLKNKWQKDSKGWVYLGSDGAMLVNKWVRDSVGWCYVGANGYAVTNCWKKDSVGWCYLNGNGSMTKSAWVKDGSKWYYLDENGYMMVNRWMKDSIGWVYLDGGGAMVTNKWVKDSVGWCYVGANGYAVTNCWKRDSVGWCYLNANGSMTKNAWVQTNGKWYYLDANGYRLTKTSRYIKNKTYHFNGNGICTNP